MTKYAIDRLIKRLRAEGTLLGTRKIVSQTETHTYTLYALGDDRFLIQTPLKGLHEERRHPVVGAKRKDLGAGRKGWLFCAGTGNFGTVLRPLLAGQLGKDLCSVPPGKRSRIIANRIVLANYGKNGLGLLQRDTDFALIVESDEWFRSIGFGLDEVSFIERTPDILRYTEERGQIWRVRPRRFTPEEITAAVQASHHRMDAAVSYFVSIRGIHWLTAADFESVAVLARSDAEAAADCLREWVGPAPDLNAPVAMRRIKYGTLHVIEFFGIRYRGAERLIIPAIERLLCSIERGDVRPEDIADTLSGISLIFRSLLASPEYADSRSDISIRALYSRVADDMDNAARTDFDARRLPLPGVTFEKGKIIPHPGADIHTLEIVRHLVSRLSLNESALWINIYAVRSTKLGPRTAESNTSREIIIKTDRTPLPASYIEKRLGSVRVGYADYMLTRANVFRALGASYPAFQLLTTARRRGSQESPYFLRTRSPGNPIDAIPPSLFRIDPTNPHGAEDPDVVLALATLYGKAAAQNLIVKKYIPSESTCRFGRGKEIFEFAYDPFRHRLMPVRMQVCSIRGTLGWPNLTRDETNLEESYRFYLRCYASVTGSYWHAHAEACTLNECASAFFDGFILQTKLMYWNYMQNRTGFDTFDPTLRPIYHFREKFDFALWALDETSKRLPQLRERFMDYVRDVFIKA